MNANSWRLVVNGTHINVGILLENLQLPLSLFFCFSKRKDWEKKTSPGGFRFPPRSPLNRPRKPPRFSWIFPAKFEKLLKISGISRKSFVGVDAHIDPADCTVFYGNLRRICNFRAGRCRHRPLQSTARIHGCSSGRQRRPPLRQPRKPYTK